MCMQQLSTAASALLSALLSGVNVLQLWACRHDGFGPDLGFGPARTSGLSSVYMSYTVREEIHFSVYSIAKWHEPEWCYLPQYGMLTLQVVVP